MAGRQAGREEVAEVFVLWFHYGFMVALWFCGCIVMLRLHCGCLDCSYVVGFVVGSGSAGVVRGGGAITVFGC